MIITVARKPLKDTVSNSVLEYGTGALNLGGSRIGTEVVSTHSRGKNRAFPKRPGEDTVEESGRKVRQDLVDHSERIGRFPSNLIYQHLENCREICVEGCPVKSLDDQCGVGVSRFFKQVKK